MTTATTPSRHGTDARSRVGVEWLRCPGERTALIGCIAANLVVVTLAFGAIIAGADWLEGHPVIAKHTDSIRAVALAAVLAFPGVPIGRQLRLHEARDSGVRVGARQFPELYERLLHACRKLEFDRVPELYLSRTAVAPAMAYSARGSNSIVVLDTSLFDKNWQDDLDWISFVMAGALGSLRLGHTRWWLDLLTAYARRIPGLRAPLRVKRAYSCDRCAAYAFPDGIRGLLAEAVGKDAVLSVRIAPFLEESKEARGAWEVLGGLDRRLPSIASRARALYEAGFFDETRDRQRFGSLPIATSSNDR